MFGLQVYESLNLSKKLWPACLTELAIQVIQVNPGSFFLMVMQRRLMMTHDRENGYQFINEVLIIMIMTDGPMDGLMDDNDSDDDAIDN